ncbi:Histidinol-phosphate aminotransferase [Candidatus Vidania fulgoroideae]|nr:Histidinol-phosphate aminotransferase [Candidatus Vidania fulgoroideae]
MNKIRLDKMEFPYRFFFKKNLLNKLDFNRYPEKKEEKKLERRISSFFGIKKNISLSNGSDEIISTYISSLKKNERLGFFEPSFSMYKKYSKIYKKKYIKVNLNKKFEIENIKIKKCKIFFISYPNNPTGNLFKKKKIENLIKKNSSTLFIVDEAYYFYSGKTLLKTLDKYNNVVIIRTFSKVGLAGLRIGFLISNKKEKRRFTKIRSPYSVNKIAIKLTLIILRKRNFRKIKNKIKKILKTKKWIIDILLKKKINVFKSRSNFFLINSKKIIIHKKILLKKISFLKKKYLRVTVGTKKELYFLNKNIMIDK